MTRQDKLRGVMAENNITQSDLAIKIGISLTSLNLKINGKMPFRLEEAYSISEILKLPIESIFLR